MPACQAAENATIYPVDRTHTARPSRRRQETTSSGAESVGPAGMHCPLRELADAGINGSRVSRFARNKSRFYRLRHPFVPCILFWRASALNFQKPASAPNSMSCVLFLRTTVDLLLLLRMRHLPDKNRSWCIHNSNRIFLGVMGRFQGLGCFVSSQNLG